MNDRRSIGPETPVLPYKRSDSPPWWVAVGLWGIPSRGAAVTYFYATLGIAVLSLLAGFVFPFAWLGVLMVLASGWYWASIRWNDRHGGWGR